MVKFNRLFKRGVTCSHPCNCCGRRKKCKDHQDYGEDELRMGKAGPGKRGCYLEGFDHMGKEQFLAGEYVPKHIEAQRPQKKTTSAAQERIAIFRDNNPNFAWKQPDNRIVRDILINKMERERRTDPAASGGFLMNQDCIMPECGKMVYDALDARCAYVVNKDGITDKVGQNPLVFGNNPERNGGFVSQRQCDFPKQAGMEQDPTHGYFDGFERLRRDRSIDPRYYYVGETELREGVFAGRDLESCADENVPTDLEIQFPQYNANVPSETMRGTTVAGTMRGTTVAGTMRGTALTGTGTRGRPQLKTIRTRNSNGYSNGDSNSNHYSDDGVKSNASFGA